MGGLDCFVTPPLRFFPVTFLQRFFAPPPNRGRSLLFLVAFFLLVFFLADFFEVFFFAATFFFVVLLAAFFGITKPSLSHLDIDDTFYCNGLFVSAASGHLVHC